MDRYDKMRNSSYLLPDPGGEVVRELLDEIAALKARIVEFDKPHDAGEQELVERTRNVTRILNAVADAAAQRREGDG